jgi:trans-2,3-dihydro-3-hydroxyanthranilate isomerase
VCRTNCDDAADARIHAPGFEALAAQGLTPDVHLYVKSADEFDIRARMFAPFDGVPEDPATGSFRWEIAQGVEMGRPSVLHARAEKRDGRSLPPGLAGRA